MFNKKTYALVLGGGGAKGSYQVGAIKALKELGIKFNAVSGTSVGALIGALVAQNDYKALEEIWNSLTLDKIISIPPKFIKDGKLNIDKDNFTAINELSSILLQGFDTKPLRDLIKKYVDEKKIRNSGIDFGIITYQISDFKPLELFLEDIAQGQLVEYLLGSASLPGFKSIEIDNKKLVDGGVYDNIPFAMIKERGYKNIIVLDISGLGINKRPDTLGTNTIYIKNSIQMGNVLEFEKAFIKEFKQLGYLDTLKVFNKINGIKYFYNINYNILKELTKLFYKKEVFDNYSKFFDKKNINYSQENIRKNIKQILPKEMKNYMHPIIALMECAATSLNIKINHLYKFEELLKLIWDHHNEIQKKESILGEKDFKNFFDRISNKLKNINISKNFKALIKYVPYEFEKALDVIFGKNKKDIHSKALAGFFPDLIPAKIFFEVLKYYFKK